MFLQFGHYQSQGNARSQCIASRSGMSSLHQDFTDLVAPLTSLWCHLIHCYKLNVCVPIPTPVVWTLTLNVMVFGDRAFGRWLVHEGGALMKGISARIKRPQRAPCAFHHPPRENTARMAVHEPGREPSPDSGFSSVLIVDFQPPELWIINVSRL